MVGASGEPLGVSAFQNLSLGTDQMRMVLAHPLFYSSSRRLELSRAAWLSSLVPACLVPDS
jgi:hypothetical protein